MNDVKIFKIKFVCELFTSKLGNSEPEGRAAHDEV